MVRKALNMAINKQAILDAVFQGAGKAAKNPIPADHLVLQRGDRGRSLRSGSGKARCLPMPKASPDLKMNIWAMPVQRPYNPNARRMAEADPGRFQGKIGVEVEIVSYEWGEYLKRSKETSTATVPSCSAGPVTTAIRTTSSAVLLELQTALAAPTAPNGATRTLRRP